MLGRLLFLFIVVFWLLMNAWLWRSEVRGRDDLGSPVPAEVVWERVLTAPDDSSLEIMHRGLKIGHCRWRANVGEEVETGKVATDEYEPEGRVTRLTGYTVDVEGNFHWDALGGRLRFNFHGDFATNHLWKEFSLRGSLRPRTWELASSAADQALRLRLEDDGVRWERKLTFAQLQDPGSLLAELGMPMPMGMGMVSQLVPLPSAGNLSLGLKWEARTDWFKIGSSKVRAYRLEAKILDKYRVLIILSRVGEILRVELPNDLVLVNDSLVNF